MLKLFLFRQTFILVLLTTASLCGNAQIVDQLLGQKRTTVQTLLKPYRIINYKKERVVHNIESGIHQTALFENDTCVKFYWAVTPEASSRFRQLLTENGYKATTSDGFVKDSLLLDARPLNSGKATLYIASLSAELKGERDASGVTVVKKKPVSQNSEVQTMPLLQQAILEEERRAAQDTTPKPKKDPKRHWVGTQSGNTSILGWDK